MMLHNRAEQQILLASWLRATPRVVSPVLFDRYTGTAAGAPFTVTAVWRHWGRQSRRNLKLQVTMMVRMILTVRALMGTATTQRKWVSAPLVR